MTNAQFCAGCGNRIDPGATFCGNCGRPVAQQQAAAPQYQAPPQYAPQGMAPPYAQAAPYGSFTCSSCHQPTPFDRRFCQFCGQFLVITDRPLKYAGYGRRIGAALLDGLIIGVVLFIIVAIAASSGSLTGIIVGYIIALVVSFGVQIYFWNQGTSLGKNLVGVKVYKTTGQVADLGTMVLREVVGKWIVGSLVGSFTLGIGYVVWYLWPLWDKDTQAPHDKIAGTVACYDPTAAAYAPGMQPNYGAQQPPVAQPFVNPQVQPQQPQFAGQQAPQPQPQYGAPPQQAAPPFGAPPQATPQYAAPQQQPAPQYGAPPPQPPPYGAPQPQQLTNRRCARCGSRLVAGATACANCGTPA